MTNSLLTEIVTIDTELVSPHPDNPRIGDIEAIKRSLAANKQFQPILVQSATGYIVAGNHTYKAAVELGWTEIDAVMLDIDDTQAKAIMLAANKTADLGGYDERLLASLLADLIESDDDDLLEGTGYSSDEVDELLSAAADFDLPDDADGEGVGLAASVLDRIMPPSDDVPPTWDDLDDDSDGLIEGASGESSAPAPTTDTVGVEQVEFVIFRFGELRAKVPRPTYERFIKSMLKQHSGDLALAGVAAAISLGIDSESVEPAVANGAERWL